MKAKDYQRCVVGGHRDSSVYCSPSHNGHVASTAGSSMLANTFRSSVCPDCWQARITKSARLEVTMKSAPWLFGVRRVRAFAMAGEIGRGGVLVAVAAAFASSSVASLPGVLL